MRGKDKKAKTFLGRMSLQLGEGESVLRQEMRALRRQETEDIQ